MSGRTMGIMMLVAGLLMATVYPYVAIYTQAGDALVKITVVAIVFLMGSFAAGVGIALLMGWREMEERRKAVSSQSG